MAITKEVKYDKVEIVGDHKHLQCREATVISEDEVEISRSFHRHVLHPNDDITNEPQEVKDIAAVVWTDEVKASWTAFQEAQAEQLA
tara:strand:+ start:463 stop:723 length:261 start_codon:yes stop_codon:yes gene_type:complete